MNLRRFQLQLLSAFAVASFLLGGATQLVAQNAGIDIDSVGVLRTTTVPDPGGHLIKTRLDHAKSSLPPELLGPSELRMISLNRLEAAIALCSETGAGLTDEMRYLAGLTRIKYVFVYPEAGDIVIAGPAEGYVHDLSGRVRGLFSGRSVLELEDLVVALRAFPPTGRRTGTIGCSIDPRPEGLAAMQRKLMQLGGRATPRDTPFIVDSLKKALGPQDVSVSGVSEKTHFAQVLVEADYRMKLIGIGLEKPAVEITSYVKKASPAAVRRNALQRWYFVPHYECVRVSDDELAMELVGDGVQLVGADELVTGAGTRVDSTSVDKASQDFVRSFTARYADLAKREPVFAQLRNLIDMTVAAAYIQDRDFYGKSGWSMSLFGDEANFPVEVHKAPKQVETAVNAVWRGRTLMTPIGGGVELQPRAALDRKHLLEDEDGSVGALRKALDVTAIDESRWWWD